LKTEQASGQGLDNRDITRVSEPEINDPSTRQGSIEVLQEDALGLSPLPSLYKVEGYDYAPGHAHVPAPGRAQPENASQSSMALNFPEAHLAVDQAQLLTPSPKRTAEGSCKNRDVSIPDTAGWIQPPQGAGTHAIAYRTPAATHAQSGGVWYTGSHAQCPIPVQHRHDPDGGVYFKCLVDVIVMLAGNRPLAKCKAKENAQTNTAHDDDFCPQPKRQAGDRAQNPARAEVGQISTASQRGTTQGNSLEVSPSLQLNRSFPGHLTVMRNEFPWSAPSAGIATTSGTSAIPAFASTASPQRHAQLPTPYGTDQSISWASLNEPSATNQLHAPQLHHEPPGNSSSPLNLEGTSIAKFDAQWPPSLEFWKSLDPSLMNEQ
jgi:hypothetical protein